MVTQTRNPANAQRTNAVRASQQPSGPRRPPSTPRSQAGGDRAAISPEATPDNRSARSSPPLCLLAAPLGPLGAIAVSVIAGASCKAAAEFAVDNAPSAADIARPFNGTPVDPRTWGPRDEFGMYPGEY